MTALRHVFLLSMCLCLLVQAADAQSASEKELFSKAQARGKVHLIVLLHAGEAGGSREANLDAFADAQKAFIAKYGGSKSPAEIRPIEGLPVIALEADSATLGEVANDADVASVREDELRFPSLSDTDSIVQARKEWSEKHAGAGYSIAILDTGVDSSHPFLARRVVAEACFSSPRDPGDSSLCPDGSSQQEGPGAARPCSEGCEHGTHVAGIAAGKGRLFSGMAPEASIIAIQVFHRVAGNKIGASDSDILSALGMVLKLSAKFKIASLNLSLGGGRFAHACDTEMPDYFQAFDQLRKAGVASVVAAGNEHFTDAMSSPACLSDAISVGSVDKSLRISEFSNSSSELALLAPGGSINSSIPGRRFESMSGTSMAAPHVAGAFAVMKSVRETASVDDILTALKQSGRSVVDSRNGVSRSVIQLGEAAKVLVVQRPPQPAPSPPGPAPDLPPKPQPSPPPPTTPAPALGDRALLVGIDQYEQKKFSLPAGSSTNDVEAMQKLLIETFHFNPSEILVLKNEQATKTGIISALKTWLVAGSKPNGRVFFYFSGHGAQIPDTSGDEADGLDETLVPYDTSLTRQNMIVDDEIGKIFDSIDDRKAIVVVDSCHSGTITRGLWEANDTGRTGEPEIARTPNFPDEIGAPHLTREALQEELVKPVQPAHLLGKSPRRSVWSAVSPHQLALVEAQSHGVFTSRFIQGLADRRADANGDGIISNAELLAFVRRSSEDYCNSIHCRLGLTPMLEAPANQLARDVVTGSQASAPDDAIGNALGPGTYPADVGIELTSGDAEKVGGRTRFRITSSVDGYIIVLAVDTEGQLKQLYPHKDIPSSDSGGSIAEGRPVTLPSESQSYTIDGPPGHGVLIAMITQDPVKLKELIDAGRNIGVADGSGYINALSERLLHLWRERLKERGVRYSVAYKKYTVVQ